ncbi:MAG: phosphatidate cytidylyltransferase [Rhizomicrobium sp.]
MGVLLAALIIAADFKGAAYLAVFVGIGVVFAAREWHRMVWRLAESYLIEMTLSATAILLALGVMTFWPRGPAAWAILACGTLVAFVIAAIRGENPFWQASGIIYIGVPSVAMIAARAIPSNGAWLIIGLLLIVWATDTGALIVGNLIGGPKLVPVLSPNKTWAGTLGGIVVAAVVEAIFVGVLGGNILLAASYGAGISVIAHAGDLFESWVKRSFKRKDSGSLIPGHGGILDRIDSTLFAVSALATLVLVVKLDPLFGAHP